MKKPKATQIYGVFVLAAGGYWLWVVLLQPLLEWLVPRGQAEAGSESEPLGFLLLFIVPFYLAMAAIGGGLIYCGIGLIKNRPLLPWTGAEDFPEEERWRGQIVVDPVVKYVRFSVGVVAAGAVILFGS